MKSTIWILAFVLLLLTGCRTTQPAPEPTPPPESTPSPAPLVPTAALPAPTPQEEGYPAPLVPESSYPAPEGTPAEGIGATQSYPAPGVAAAGTEPGDCATAPEQRFARLLQSQPALSETLGCPAGEATQTAAAWQVFEDDNQMVWLKSEDTILALYDGQWHGFEDTFEESDPTHPPGAPTPPAGDLILPRRGFGKVWINIVDEMGFGVSEEAGYDATLQRFERGWLVTTPYGQVLVLEGLSDAQQGRGDYQAWLEQDGEWVQG